MTVWEILREFLVPVGTGVAGYFVGKPRMRAEIDSTNIENSKQLFAEYKELVEMRKMQGLEHENTISELRSVISTLEDTISRLNDTIDDLKDDNYSCKKALKAIMEERDNLQKEVEKLKVLLKFEENEGLSALDGDIQLN